MTLIVGIKCTDGVVLGSDGAATYATPLGQPTMVQPISKLMAVGEQVILGLSGPVGLGQSYFEELYTQFKTTQNLVRWRSMAEARTKLTDSFWKHARPYWDRAGALAPTIGQANAYREVGHATVVAFPLDGEPRLVQFDQKCAAEEATADLPFLAIGGGQQTADPFLAFIRRVFWPESLPSIDDGIFAAIWTLEYSIKAQPGGISEPIQLMVLQQGRGDWRVRELSDDDLGQHRQMTKTLEQKLPSFVRSILEEAPTTPIPTF